MCRDKLKKMLKQQKSKDSDGTVGHHDIRTLEHGESTWIGGGSVQQREGSTMKSSEGITAGFVSASLAV